MVSLNKGWQDWLVSPDYLLTALTRLTKIGAEHINVVNAIGHEGRYYLVVYYNKEDLTDGN
jgi:hypothetical protein